MKKKSKTPKKLKIALAHDYLAEYGGAERVLEALHKIYPEAPVYVSFIDSKRLGIHWEKFKDWDIRTTWLTKIPLHKELFSPLRIFAPQYFSSLDLSKYDLVITSTNAYFSKAVKVPNGVQVCYCHTPARSLYGYTTMTNWKKRPLVRFFGTLINHYLRVVDFQVAQNVDHFIANSREVQKRIEKYFRRESEIIHPPVIVPKKLQAEKKADEPYYLYVNRLAYAKHPELAVTAATHLSLPLKVVGVGSILPELKKMAGSTVEFLGAVSDSELHELYSGAEALIYPAEDEDFGMIPIEAMGYGVPVLAHKSGGPKETIIDGETGLFFDALTEQAVIDAISHFQTMKFDRKKIHAHARKYSVEEFEKKMKQFVKNVT